MTHSITSSLNHSSIYSSARSIIPSPTHSITHPITPSLVLHSFIHSAMHFFTDSTTHLWVWKGRAALLGFPVCVYFWLKCSPFGVTGMLCEVFLIIPPAQQSCWGVYWFHLVRPSVRPSVRPASVPRPSCIPCPLCSAYSSGWIHFIFVHHIKQLQKVCHMYSFLQNFKIWIFGNFFSICSFDFVLFWLGVWCESLVWVIMGRRGVSQNTGVLVVLVS